MLPANNRHVLKHVVTQKGTPKEESERPKEIVSAVDQCIGTPHLREWFHPFCTQP